MKNLWFVGLLAFVLCLSCGAASAEETMVKKLPALEEVSSEGSPGEMTQEDWDLLMEYRSLASQEAAVVENPELMAQGAPTLNLLVARPALPVRELPVDHPALEPSELDFQTPFEMSHRGEQPPAQGRQTLSALLEAERQQVQRLREDFVTLAQEIEMLEVHQRELEAQR